MSFRTYKIKRTVTYRGITFILTPPAGVDLPDFTGATGILKTRPNGSVGPVTEMSGTVTITVGERQAEFHYAWAAGETDATADLDGEFVITLASGIMILPQEGFIRIIITDDLGDAT